MPIYEYLALVEPPAAGIPAKSWRQGGYLEKGKVPKDPWDNDFFYISPGVHGDFDLSSLGVDGEPGGDCCRVFQKRSCPTHRYSP
jgi:general secretion pathway protein G